MIEQPNISELVRLVKACKVSIFHVGPERVFTSLKGFMKAFVSSPGDVSMERIDEDFFEGLLVLASSSADYGAWCSQYRCWSSDITSIMSGPDHAVLFVACICQCLMTKKRFVPLFKSFGGYRLLKGWIDKYHSHDVFFSLFCHFIMKICDDPFVGKDLIQIGAIDYLLNLSGKNDHQQSYMLAALNELVYAVGSKRIARYNFNVSDGNLAALSSIIVNNGIKWDNSKAFVFYVLPQLMKNESMLQLFCKPGFVHPIVALCSEALRPTAAFEAADDCRKDTPESVPAGLMNIIGLFAKTADTAFVLHVVKLIPRMLEILSENVNHFFKIETLGCIVQWCNVNVISREVFERSGITVLQHLITGQENPFLCAHPLPDRAIQVLTKVIADSRGSLFSTEDLRAVWVVFSSMVSWLDDPQYEDHLNFENVTSSVHFLCACFALEFPGSVENRLDWLKRCCCCVGYCGNPILGSLAIYFNGTILQNVNSAKLKTAAAQKMDVVVYVVSNYLTNLPVEIINSLCDDLRWAHLLCMVHQKACAALPQTEDEAVLCRSPEEFQRESEAFFTQLNMSLITTSNETRGVSLEQAKRIISFQEVDVASKQQVCAQFGCSITQDLKKCAHCLQVAYCGSAHQKSDWKIGHKYKCGKVRSTRIDASTLVLPSAEYMKLRLALNKMVDVKAKDLTQRRCRATGVTAAEVYAIPTPLAAALPTPPAAALAAAVADADADADAIVTALAPPRDDATSTPPADIATSAAAPTAAAPAAPAEVATDRSTAPNGVAIREA